MKTATEEFTNLASARGWLRCRLIEVETIQRIQSEAKATGRAEGMREAVQIISGRPWNAVGAGDSMISQQDAIEAILAAIDRKEGMTE